MEQVSTKTALIIYFVIIPILVITGYNNHSLMMAYFVALWIISIYLTIFND